MTSKDLISRMSPTTLAGLISDLDQYGNLDQNERDALKAARLALECNVGKGRAEELVAAACGGYMAAAEVT